MQGISILMKTPIQKRKKPSVVTRFFIPLVLAAGLLGAATGQAQGVLEIPLYSFLASPDGYVGVGTLILGADNFLYGTTYGGGTNSASPGGTIFKIGRDGSGYKVLRSFSQGDTGDNGTAFYSIGLSVARGSDGALYGTTRYGGTNGAGSVFKMNSDGFDFTILHSFTGNDGYPFNLMQGSDGVLYGAGATAIFKLNPDGGGYEVLHTFTNAIDGSVSLGKLVQGYDGALYGVTTFGGANNGGTVFKLNTDGSGFMVLHSFPDGTGDGYNSHAGLIQGSDGALYGTTESGGTNSDGTVFKLQMDGSGYTVLHNFAPVPDGGSPEGSLVQGLGNVLYGTTQSGGAANLGTVFKLGLDGNGYNILYNFTDPHNWRPFGGLVQGPASGGAGVLYGITSYNFGGVFGLVVNPPLSITPVTSQTASNQTAVFWPAWALGAVLQTTTNLASGTWVTVSNAVPMAGVQLTNSLPAAYYRLIWQ